MSLHIKIKPLILVGCSGSGRSAIIFNLTRNLSHKFERLVSHTTRPPRPSQVNNRDFYFTQQPWIKQNLDKFVTLTYSGNGNYYGLTGEEVTRVMTKNKIPIFRMTLDAFVTNTAINKNDKETNNSLDIKNTQNQQKINENRTTNNVHLIRANNIVCNALYITVPSIKQLQKRLKYSPLSPKQQSQKIEKAKSQRREAAKYFSAEDIIGKYHDLDTNEQDDQPFEDNLMRIKSRLFELY